MERFILLSASCTDAIGLNEPRVYIGTVEFISGERRNFRITTHKARESVDDIDDYFNWLLKDVTLPDQGPIIATID